MSLRLIFLALVSMLSTFSAKALPDLFTTEGNAIALAQLPHPAIVIFWDPDCAYCRKELLEIRQDHDPLLQQQLVIVGLLPPKAVKKLTSSLPAAARLLAIQGTPSDVLEHFGNGEGTLPYAVILGAHGGICQRLSGSQSLPALRAALATCSN